MKLVTTEQMRALEEETFAEGEKDIWDLMDAAGLAAAQEAWIALRIIEDRLVLALCGPGNNGSDGIVAAFHLKEMGARVHCYLLEARPEDDPPWEALHNHDIPFTLATDDPDYARLDALIAESSGVLDALLGTGSNRPIEGTMAGVLDHLREAREHSRTQLVALDIPTGVDPNSGHVDEHTVAADITVSFGFIKTGLYQNPGRRFAGEVIRADIGLTSNPQTELPYEEIDYRAVQRSMPVRAPDAHKGSFGKAFIAAGSLRFPGAAVLAAEACARSGAGLTAIAAPEVAQPLFAMRFPDAIHEPLPSSGGTVNGEAARALLRALPGADALLVGPGLGHTPDTEEFVRGLLAGLDGIEGLRGVVLDADALNALAGQPGWHERFQAPRIVTPHPGEMARLLGTTVEQVQADRLGLATGYARTINGVVVLKGACTVIAAPDGRARISGAMNSMLATAGTGDVLAGLIAGFLAQGVGPFDAATAAVYAHSEAASAVAKEYGEAAGLAQDLLRTLPDVRKHLDGQSSSISRSSSGMGGFSGMGGGGLGDMGGLGGLAGMGGLGGGMSGMPDFSGLGGQGLGGGMGQP
jgi:NAD(P)H-hydrate epimerase